ncbi:MAG: extracellular solute-binding protein [Methanomicrobiales archaeon]|nr:extracellular solute-binding protein [Methanomicrobiales archaeon]
MAPDNGTACGLLIACVAAIAILAVSAGCTDPGARVVVVYTSVDQVYAEPVLAAFEEQSGITVKAVYDVEATKTTGLVNRLIAEKERPLADVFWNGEFMQTLLLKEEGVLAPYESPQAASIPAQYRDPDGCWAGVGGRARVLLVNTDRVSAGDYPTSVFDLASETYDPADVGIAYPMFGTSATHAAALYAALGEDEGRTFYQGLRDRGVRVLDGNSVVRDLVADGRLKVGLTDTDDACRAYEDGAPVALVLPDQGGIGTLVIPNTVALIAGAPHADEGKELVDFLLSPDTERLLLDIGWVQVAVRDVGESPSCIGMENVRGMNVSAAAVHAELEQAQQDLTAIFIR